ncbi:hypothetical protein JW859_10255 [bacterium]|nr:hypothetical protein [bacterium]
MNRMLTLAVALCTVACWPLAALAADEDYVSDYEQELNALYQASGECPSEVTYDVDPIEAAVAQFFYNLEETPGRYRPDRPKRKIIDLDRKPLPQLSYSGQIYGKYSDDDISELEKWEKELELKLRWGDWDSYFRFSDVNAFHNEEDPFRWEKGRLRWRGEDATATLGSFGQLFGRGLVLNMYEDRILEHDNEIEGAKVEYDLGDAELIALWGTCKQRDELTHSTVSGARLSGEIARGVDIGAHFANVEFPADTYTVDAPDMFDYSLYGGDLTVRSGPVRLFIESARLERDPAEFAGSIIDQEGDTGKAVYASVSVDGDGFVVGAEYKDYRGMLHPFGVAPPIRRWGEAATSDPTDDKGYGVFLTMSPFQDGSSFEFSYAQDNLHAKGLLNSEFAGIYSSPATRKTSWVAEYWYVNHLLTKHNIKKVTLNHQLSDDWTSTAMVEHEKIDPGFIDQYTDMIYELELAFQSKANLAYTLEKTGEAEATDDSWGIWEFKFKPDDRQELNVAYGSRREGITCSGGVCRLEPEFDGIKVDYLIRF